MEVAHSPGMRRMAFPVSHAEEKRKNMEQEIGMFDIQEELKKLPGRPGVYLMHDEKDEIIYVGKQSV